MAKIFAITQSALTASESLVMELQYDVASLFSSKHDNNKNICVVFIALGIKYIIFERWFLHIRTIDVIEAAGKLVCIYEYISDITLSV